MEHTHPDSTTYADWLNTGIARGWISDVVCSVHTGLPLTAAEEAFIDSDDGWDDVCVFGVRVWGPDGKHDTYP